MADTLGGWLGRYVATRVKLPLPYERAAERATVTGWACLTCRRWWGNDGRAEHMARYCCAPDLPCDCGGRMGKGWACCDACRRRHDAERWAEALAKGVEWDGETPLCEWDGDRFFFGPDDVEEYLEDHDGEDDAPTLEGLRLCLCEPAEARGFSMADYLFDDLGEDDDTDFADIDATVNNHIAGVMRGRWQPTRVAVTLGSVRRFVREPGEEG